MGIGFFLLAVLYGFFLIPLIAVRNNVEQQYLLLGIEIWGGCCLISFLPLVNSIIKKTWFFPSEGEPVSHSLLLSLLQEINNFNSPLIVRKTRKKLILTWRVDEPGWEEKIEKAGVKKLYELHLHFDNHTKTVSMSDRFRSVKWDYLGKKSSTGWFAFPSPFFKIELGKQWGVDNYKNGSPESYNFLPEEIKSPLLNSIIRNGWNVRFAIF